MCQWCWRSHQARSNRSARLALPADRNQISGSRILPPSNASDLFLPWTAVRFPDLLFAAAVHLDSGPFHLSHLRTATMATIGGVVAARNDVVDRVG